MLPAVIQPQELTEVNKQLAIRRGTGYRSDYVPHISFEDVKRMVEGCKERDGLLIQFLFDGCLRASEATRVQPNHIRATNDGWAVDILGKGKKRGQVAISAGLAAQLEAYCYRRSILSNERIFPINRPRVFQIVAAAMKRAGVVKPEGVGTVHVLRHSGAIERLRRTGNPKAVQDQLRHKSALMTLRYLKTLSEEESLKIQQEVDLPW